MADIELSGYFQQGLSVIRMYHPCSEGIVVFVSPGLEAFFITDHSNKL